MARTRDSADHLQSREDMAAYIEAALEDGDAAVVAAALGDPPWRMRSSTAWFTMPTRSSCTANRCASAAPASATTTGRSEAAGSKQRSRPSLATKERGRKARSGALGTPQQPSLPPHYWLKAATFWQSSTPASQRPHGWPPCVGTGGRNRRNPHRTGHFFATCQYRVMDWEIVYSGHAFQAQHGARPCRDTGKRQGRLRERVQSQKTPQRELEVAGKRLAACRDAGWNVIATKTHDEMVGEWLQDPAFAQEYEGLEQESGRWGSPEALAELERRLRQRRR